MEISIRMASRTYLDIEAKTGIVFYTDHPYILLPSFILLLLESVGTAKVPLTSINQKDQS